MIWAFHFALKEDCDTLIVGFEMTIRRESARLINLGWVFARID